MNLDDPNFYYKKKRVNNACFQCKKAHKKCDNERPCSNCKKSNKECIVLDEKKIGGILSNLSKSMKGDSSESFKHIIDSINNDIVTPKNTTAQKNEVIINKMDSPIIMQDLNENVNDPSTINKNSNQEDQNEEIKKLREEIEKLSKEINEIDRMNLPGDLEKLDPIEFILLKQKQNPGRELLPNHQHSQCRFFLAYFKEPLSLEQYNHHNLIISNISSKASHSFGLDPSEMHLRPLYDFTLKYSESILKEFSKVRKLKKLYYQKKKI